MRGARLHWTWLAALAGALAIVVGGAAAHPEPSSDGGISAEDGARDTHQHGRTTGHLPA